MNPPNASWRKLDSVVVDIELTLNSIVQGVALVVLTEKVPEVFSWAAFLYTIAALCVILTFWLRSIIDTLTLIKWPLDWGHNFLYIGCAMCEVILFRQLSHPLRWFQLSVAYSVLVWLLYIRNMRLIHARVAESNSDAERALYTRARADQLLNIWLLVPLFFLFNVGCVVAIWIWWDLFVDQGGHIWMISWQLLSFMGYLTYVVWYFKRIAPLVLRSCQSEETELTDTNGSIH